MAFMDRLGEFDIVVAAACKAKPEASECDQPQVPHITILAEMITTYCPETIISL